MDQGNRACTRFFARAGVAVNYADVVGSVHMVDLVHAAGSLQ